MTKSLEQQIEELKISEEKARKINHANYVINNSENYTINLLQWYREELVKALSLINQLQDWQPIETAPKMKAILIYSTQIDKAHFNTTNNKWWVYTDGTKTAKEKLLNSWSPPTHWMPLPKPPAKEN